jgi:hypothetical protein
LGCRSAAIDSARGGSNRLGRRNSEEANGLHPALAAHDERNAHAPDANEYGNHRRIDHPAHDDRRDHGRHDHCTDDRPGNDDSDHDDRFDHDTDHNRGNHVDHRSRNDHRSRDDRYLRNDADPGDRNDHSRLRMQQPRLSAGLLHSVNVPLRLG